MQTPYLYLSRFILALCDLVLISSGFIVASFLSFKQAIHADRGILNENILISAIIWFLTTSTFKLYALDVIKLEYIYRATWKSVVLHCLVFVSFLLIAGHSIFDAKFLIAFYSIIILGFILSRFIITALQSILERNFDIRKSVAILGMNTGGQKLAAYLQKQEAFKFSGFLDDEQLFIDENGGLVTVAAQQMQKAAFANIDEVFVALSSESHFDIGCLVKEAEKNCVRLKFVPDFSNEISGFTVDQMDGFSVLSVRNDPLQDIHNRLKKRIFDIVLSTMVIVFVLSWLYPLLAILIKMQSAGPVLYKQLRSGKDNEPFYCYKFRSMRVVKNSESKQATRYDDRITPIGRFMRKTSLDEFPQFVNVLFGDMSIAGPRPHMIDHTEKYRNIIDQYMVRHFLKPGITGWAQVKGFRGETKEHHLMDKRVKHDIWYMENWSLMLDVRIVFMTVISVILGNENAY